MEPARKRGRQLVPPLDVEALLAQGLVLGLELGALGRVRREAQAAGPAEGVASQVLEPVEVALGQAPQRMRLFRSEPAASVVVRGGSAPQREAAVSSAGTARDLARFQHAHAQAGLRKHVRAGAAGDAPADHGDIDHSVRTPDGRCRPRFREPVRARHVAEAIPAPSPLSKRRGTPLRRRPTRAPSAPSPARRRRAPSRAQAGRRPTAPRPAQRAPPRRARRARRTSGIRLEAERGEDVCRARERRRSQPQQRVRSGRKRRRDLSRDREDFASSLEREVGRDQGAAALAGLDDHGGRSEAGDDPVARREPPWRRLDPWRVFRDDKAPFADAARELGVGSGVVPVDSAAENGDGCPAGFERATVRLRVHASRHPAHDDEARRCKLTRELSRDLAAVRRARPSADDGDGRLAEQSLSRGAAEKEAGRRVVELPHEAWEALGRSADEAIPAPPAPRGTQTRRTRARTA